MQIKLTNYQNAAKYLSVPKVQGTERAATGGMFGAQCKVSISSEGKKLSKQSQQPVSQNSKITELSRLMDRQEEQSQRLTDDYSRMVDSVNDLINKVKNTGGTADKETIEKAQEALDTLKEQKEKQEEENERLIQQATDAVTFTAKQQEEIDKSNSDLLVMLKSMEDKDQENDQNDDSQEDRNDTDASNVGTEIRDSASQLKSSALRKMQLAEDKIDGLEENGLEMLSQVNDMINDIKGDLDQAEAALGDESLSAEERMQMAAEYAGRAETKAMDKMDDMLMLKGKGMQSRQDYRDLKLKQIAINPMQNVSKTQGILMDAAVDAVWREASQGIIEDASQELTDRVQEEIDQRNDITPTPEEQTEEEQQEILENKQEEEKLEEEELAQEKIEQETEKQKLEESN